MGDVNRTDLKYNFLKSIIVRLDFTGVLESEMEKVLIHIKPFAKDRGFSKYIEKITGQIDLSLVDKGAQESSEFSNKVKRQKVYSFIDENRGVVLDVSNSFVCLTINTVQYISFDSYCEIVPHVAGIYKDCIDFFSVARFGIRKMNECLIEDKAQIRNYFNPEYYSYFSQLEGIDTLQSNHVNVFSIGKCRINHIANISQGQYEGKTVYSIRLDIDAYFTTAEDIQKLLDSKEELLKVNDLIFKVYVHSLTRDFVSSLMSEEYDGGLLIGVERNG